MTSYNRILSTTQSVAKELEPHGVTLEDILRLHQFGFLTALNLPKPIITNIQLELDSVFPEDKPSHLQACTYRLAMELIHESPKFLSTFIAPRLHYSWDTGATYPYNPAISWRHVVRSANLHDEPQLVNEKILRNIGYSVIEQRPRLIDRLQSMTDAEILSYLSVIQDKLTDLQYNSLYQYRFSGASFGAIARARNCSASNIAFTYHAAVRKIRWYRADSISLRDRIFGRHSIGEICEATS